MTIKIWEAIKDPDDTKDYRLDWTDRLEGETIVASEWFIVSGGDRLTIEDSYTDTTAVIWVSGGRVGTVVLTNRITDSAVPPHTYDQTVKLYIQEK